MDEVKFYRKIKVIFKLVDYLNRIVGVFLYFFLVIFSFRGWIKVWLFFLCICWYRENGEGRWWWCWYCRLYDIRIL